MKKPALKNLEYNKAETRKIRAGAHKPQNVKITININGETLIHLRDMAAQTGIPYQRLLNKLLKEGLGKTDSTESRLAKLEKGLERLKKKLAA